MTIDPHNTFRPTDAFEYVDAYRTAVMGGRCFSEERLAALAARMGDNPSSRLLAAYRGYEAALLFITEKVPPGVVKLDDTDPTPIERLTPAGYQL